MASQPVLSNERGEPNRTSVAASAGIGVLTAAVGYLLAAVLVAGEASEAVGDDVADWKGIAWYYYNAHLVDIEGTLEGTSAIGDFGGTETVNFIAQSESTRVALLYVVPPAVLLLAGAALAVQFDARDIESGVLVGAPVTVGYGVVAALGAVVAEANGQWSMIGIEASGSMAPELLPAVVLAGVLYPLVFATAGALLTAALRSR